MGKNCKFYTKKKGILTGGHNGTMNHKSHKSKVFVKTQCLNGPQNDVFQDLI
jgi:hypothetical protein